MRCTSNLDIGLVNEPPIANAVTTRPSSVDEKRREALHPSVDGDMVDFDASFGQNQDRRSNHQSRDHKTDSNRAAGMFQRIVVQSIQTLMSLAPTTHYVSLAQSILFRGAGIDVVWPEFLVIAAIGTVFLALAHHRLRHTIGTMQN